MRAEITFITPDLAKELLKKNIGNRRMKGIKNAYVGQMLNGEWKENGEPIIIDTEGIIKVWNLYASGDMSVKDIRVDSKVREKVQKL